jgi:tripartite ATP-independent transporter DctP family solute receptor
MKKTSLTVALSLALSLTAVSAEEITLHLGHVQQANHPMQISSEAFAELVNKRTNGAIKIVSHPAEQLAGLRAGAEGVQLGTIDMYWSDSGTLGNWAPKYGFVSLPFIFEDFESSIAVMDSLEESIVASMRADLNVERLAWSPSGFRVILSRNSAVNSAEDMRGLKIRVPEIPLYVSAFGALHSNATPLPWGDVYSALQSGVVDAVEGPPAAIVTSALQEVVEHMTRTNHIMTDLNLLMNLDRFNGLSLEHQQIIRESAKEVVNLGLRGLLAADEGRSYEVLSAALQTNETPDVGSFRGAMSPVYAEFIAGAGEDAAAWVSAAQDN